VKFNHSWLSCAPLETWINIWLYDGRNQRFPNRLMGQLTKTTYRTKVGSDNKRAKCQLCKHPPFIANLKHMYHGCTWCWQPTVEKQDISRSPPIGCAEQIS
jgi:hypothetical protein